MRPVAALMIVVVAAAFVACGGGGESEFEVALDELTAAGLSVLVLPPDQLGEIAEGFVIDPGSGPETAAESADGTLDPDDTAADLEARGYIAGYELALEAQPIPEDGVFQVESSVVLYDDAGGVDEALDKFIEDVERFQGEEVGGAALIGWAEFDAGKRGDRRIGLTIEVAVPDTDIRVYGILIAFRIGRLGASVSIASLDDDNRTADAKVLAERLETHIRAVLLGETAATVVPIPEEDDGGDDTTTADPPPGVPDLSPLVLRAADLPAGFVLDREGYDSDPSGEAEYVREFEAESGSVEIGTSRIATIQSGAILFASEAESLVFLTTIDSLFASEDAVETVFGAALAEEGFTETELESERFELELGEGGVALVARGETRFGKFAFAFIVFREGPYVGNLIVVGVADGFRVADVGRLAELMVERMASAPR